MNDKMSYMEGFHNISSKNRPVTRVYTIIILNSTILNEKWGHNIKYHYSLKIQISLFIIFCYKLYLLP